MKARERRVPVRLASGSYGVHVAPSGPQLLVRYLSRRRRPWLVVMDENVRRLHWQALAQQLHAAGLEVPEPLVLVPGERSKSMSRLSFVLRTLLRRNLERRACLVAFGGGVITDLAGMAAATYRRGIPWIAAPTTLLGMVDAAVGGKVGVNLLRTKNAVGCFHQPEAVLAGTDYLRTLPAVERRNGLAEVVKYAMIADRALWRDLLVLPWRRLGRSEHHDVPLVARCCRIKARVVAADPHEQGRRQALNFGHTVGHALEALGNLRHGEAVALGMIVACVLAEDRGLAKEPLRQPLVHLLRHLGLPTRLPAPVPYAALRRFLWRDKKVQDGSLRFVLTPRIGRVSMSHAVGEIELRSALEAIAPR